tara:strand:+ start:615 stop:1391 length:777 start_codon:yes stop_codon:yes gene_type:complete
MMKMEKQSIEKVVCPMSGKELNAVWLDSAGRAWTTNSTDGGYRVYVVTKMTDLAFDTSKYVSYQTANWTRLMRLTVSRDGKEYDVSIPVKNTHESQLGVSKSKHYTYEMTEGNDGSLGQVNLGYTDLYSKSPTSNSPLFADYLRFYGLEDAVIHFRDGKAKIIALHGYYSTSYINFLGSFENPKRIIFSNFNGSLPHMYDLELYVTEEGKTSTGQDGLSKPCVNHYETKYLPVIYHDARKYKFTGKKTYDYENLEVLG